ncbi:MAG: beta-lactamase family protein [Pseudomonadales bacterium]|nr:beta-lactamase family protein [Pseudomonadales bacterium]MCP5184079.1 beta-lactamase family protein [Pseudomonadales bacterium]
MAWYVDEGILSCVNTLVMRGTDVLDFRLFGYMDLESRTPLREDAIYRMHSNTKIVTSVAAMQLVEMGRLDLDAPVERYLPAFAHPRVLRADATEVSHADPAGGSIRVRHLLSHSAGLSYGFIEPDSLIDKAYAAAGINLFGGEELTLEELCDRLGSLPLVYEPGTNWRYSLATDVVARIVEVVSGQRFDDYLEEHIFRPLGMVDTAFHVSPEKVDRLVTMYAPTDLFNPMKPGLVKAEDPATGPYSRPRRFLSGGGGLVSTVADYLAFIRMIVNGGTWNGATLLKPETLALMRTNQLSAGVHVAFPMWAMPGTVFGLGFAIKQAVGAEEPLMARDEYHWGGMAGTHSWMAPNAGITGMCMTQRMPGFWHPFSHEFKAMAYRLAGRAS